MPRTDPAGVEHPTNGDIPTDDGYLHIANCPQCVCDFDGPVLWFAREVKARHDSKPNPGTADPEQTAGKD